MSGATPVMPGRNCAEMREFIMLISIAFVIAVPLVWYFMHSWLNNFVNRVDINWGVFAAGGMAALMIALITVSSQASARP